MERIIEEILRRQEALNILCLQDDPCHQLEYGHPASFRDLDDANEHHFIESDIAISHTPVERLDGNVLAVLKSAQISRSLPHLGQTYH
jgi:hypothetical protein